jgi:cyclopropane fatty-acyl-phospholipid synthase-like methyltransferase
VNEITAADYDLRIKNQSLDQIIDAYYEPKEGDLKRRVQIVLGALKPSKQQRVLDIGCGVGTFAFHACRSGAECWGIDYSFESIKVAQVLCRRYQRPVKFMLADACHLPFSDHCFDAVVAADFFEHVTLEDKGAILKEIKRALKINGTAIIFTPNGVREKIGALYWRVRHFLFGGRIPGTDLHFGLTHKLEFERLLESNGFTFRLYYHDVTRPYLARIPGIRTVFALNLLWVIGHRDTAAKK